MRFPLACLIACAAVAAEPAREPFKGIRVVARRDAVQVDSQRARRGKGVIRPPSGAGNFAADLAGDPDDRPGTWGRAGAVVVPLVFSPPAGYRVRIVSARGNCQTWPTTMGAGIAIVEPGRYYGVLCGASTTAPAGSTRADLMADNTPMYVQTHLGSKPEPFHFTAPRVLEPDHTLNWVMAVWLNDTGLMAHIELTFYDLVYEFVPEETLDR